MVKDLFVEFQYRENYGAHTWDGNGECPQHWKMKGGEELIVTDVPEGVDLESIIDAVRVDHEWFGVGSEHYVIGYNLVESGYQTEFERDQYEFEGEVFIHAKRISYRDLMLKINV